MKKRSYFRLMEIMNKTRRGFPMNHIGTVWIKPTSSKTNLVLAVRFENADLHEVQIIDVIICSPKRAKNDRIPRVTSMDGFDIDNSFGAYLRYCPVPVPYSLPHALNTHMRRKHDLQF